MGKLSAIKIQVENYMERKKVPESWCIITERARKNVCVINL